MIVPVSQESSGWSAGFVPPTSTSSGSMTPVWSTDGSSARRGARSYSSSWPPEVALSARRHSAGISRWR